MFFPFYQFTILNPKYYYKLKSMPFNIESNYSGFLTTNPFAYIFRSKQHVSRRYLIYVFKGRKW